MSKINKILAKWLPGDVHTLRWFESHGVGQRIAYGYSKTGAIRKIGHGVFSLPDDRLDWMGAIRALQEELALQVHVGGRTALELQGATHNIAGAATPQITIITTERIAVPTWVKDNDWSADLIFRRSSLVSAEQSITEFTRNGITIKLASREQAILELVDSLDLSESFETAENYLSSLMTLRPKMMQDLLERCSSFKVKRVFLYLTEKLELPFFSKLQLDAIDLGSGKRVVVKGGHWNPKYQITVPREGSEASVGF
jgi:hypothetical protein